jgi:ribosome-binding protein aMBF1 (putative translation factor)
LLVDEKHEELVEQIAERIGRALERRGLMDTSLTRTT